MFLVCSIAQYFYKLCHILTSLQGQSNTTNDWLASRTVKPQTKSLWQNIVQSSTHQSPRTDLINSLLQMIILLDDAIFFLSYVSAGVQQNNLFERRSWQTVVGKQNILLSMNTVQIIQCQDFLVTSTQSQWFKFPQSASLQPHSFIIILNPLVPKSDQHLISPYNITPESNMKVMRIEEMITN